MSPEVLARKPSGLALVRLGCGCEQWMRVTADGASTLGRLAKSCGPNKIHATPDFGTRVDEAAAHLRAVQAVSP